MSHLAAPKSSARRLCFPIVAIILGVALFSTGGLRADTITLVTGETIRGTIVHETDQAVTISIQVSAAITDERTIQRDDIKSVDKTQADEIAFREIKDLRTDPESSYALPTYERILSMLKGYLEKYPQSPNAAEVRSRMDAFRAERDRAAAGEVKDQGEWISRPEAEKRRYQIEASQLFAGMKEAASRADYITALNTMVRIEKDYPGARVYPESVDLARQILPVLNAEVTRRIDALKRDQEQWKQGVALASEVQKAQLIAAQKAEQAQMDAALAGSDAKWKPLLPKSEKSLLAIQKLIPAEQKRLEAIKTDVMRQSLQLVEEAKAAASAYDFVKADGLLKQAVTLWKQNESASRWQVALVAMTARGTPTPAVVEGSEEKAAAERPKKGARPKVAAPAEEKPFYLTIKGAAIIVGVIIAIVGIATVVNRRKPQQSHEG